jgi:hypothetical protein
MIKPISVVDTRRTSRRQSFMIRATIVAEADLRHSGRVRDLSTQGIKIELDAQPAPPMQRGDTVSVELRGIGKVKAEIVWRRSHWYGLRFARPIRPELAMKSVGKGETTPDYVKPVLVPGRALKYVEGL